MTSADAVRMLAEAGIATAAAIVLALLARQPLHAWGGWRAAYAVWAVVPAAALATLLPAPTVPAAMDASAVDLGGASLYLAGAVHTAAVPHWPVWTVSIWALGALAMLSVLAARQAGFLRRIGTLRRRTDGLWQADACIGLPAVVGMRQRIVLPADFEARYVAPERDLVLAHERCHVRRGDGYANAIAALLRCAFWFNPLCVYAYARYRRDQELACDEAVVALHPHARRAYGEAMLKTELSLVPAPMACHWFGHHPLKERIAMLTRSHRSTHRRSSALALACALSLVTAYAAWAGQTPQASVAASANTGAAVAGTPIDLRMKLRSGTRSSAPRVIVRSGGAFHVRIGQDQRAGSEDLAFDGVASLTGDGRIRIELQVLQGGRVLGTPAIVVAQGVPATIRGGDTPDGPFAYVLDIDASADPARTKIPPPSPAAAMVPVRNAIAANDTPSTHRQAATSGSELPPPAYPPDALEAKTGGKVVLELLVAVDGSVKDVRVVESVPTGVFDRPAIDAARKWRMKPQMRRGKPVEGWMQVPITFEPEHREQAARG